MTRDHAFSREPTPERDIWDRADDWRDIQQEQRLLHEAPAASDVHAVQSGVCAGSD